MTSERCRQVARKVLTSLRRQYGRHAAMAKRPALEEMLIGILSEGSSERKALAALNAITRSFVDWNEVRVSSPCEIAAAISPVPEAVAKAAVICRVLQKVYDVTNELSLDFLKDKGPRDATRLVADIRDFPESALARVTLFSLGHTVLPLTPGVLTICRRIGILEDGQDHAAMLGRIDKVVPRSSMFEFHWLLSRHSSKVCLPAEPACDACPIRGDCRTGRNTRKDSKVPSGAARPAGKAKRTRK